MKYLMYAVIAAVIMISPRAEASSVSDRFSCIVQIREAELYYGIPRGLLLSIAFVESGYNGTPWPWTLNIDNKGYHVDSREEALDMMFDEKGNLRRNMAVGCMQIYTNYHADKFDNPRSMIDPKDNVWYAGSFLRSLMEERGSWIEAIGRYHANNEFDRRSYTCRVLYHRIRLGFQTQNREVNKLCSGEFYRFLSKG